MNPEVEIKDRFAQLSKNLLDEEQIIHAMVSEIESLESLLSPTAQSLVETIRPLTITNNAL